MPYKYRYKIMCGTHSCNDLNKFIIFNNHQTSKKRIRESRRTSKNNGYRLRRSRFCIRVLSNSTQLA